MQLQHRLVAIHLWRLMDDDGSARVFPTLAMLCMPCLGPLSSQPSTAQSLLLINSVQVGYRSVPKLYRSPSMLLWAKSTSARFLLFENVVGIVPVRLQDTGGC